MNGENFVIVRFRDGEEVCSVLELSPAIELRLNDEEFEPESKKKLLVKPQDYTRARLSRCQRSRCRVREPESSGEDEPVEEYEENGMAPSGNPWYLPYG